MDFIKLDQLKSRLSSLKPLNTTELKRLRNEFIIDNTYNSNAIEGNTLTLRETALIIQEGITIAEKPLRDHLEAIGHKDAFEYIVTLADDNVELSEKVIKDIHTLVLMDDAANRGVYRNVPVRILGAKNSVPGPFEIPEMMTELLLTYGTIKKEKHIIEAVSEFHLKFESIHPFVDGNGRTGRLVLNLELIKAGFLPINIKFSDKVRYYNCFDNFHNENSISDFTELVFDYETEELVKRIKVLESRN